jgi:hypothetical protein
MDLLYVVSCSFQHLAVDFENNCENWKCSEKRFGNFPTLCYDIHF